MRILQWKEGPSRSCANVCGLGTIELEDIPLVMRAGGSQSRWHSN
jgi:hypothetical protein